MNDTIAAIATGQTRTAIGILRLSGPEAIAAVNGVFRPHFGGDFAACPDRKLVLGTLYDADGQVLDEALATLSRAPHSYTGEDTAELQCHGSPTVLTMALEALFAKGARQALAGEFTKRAFLNGQLDLTQAEAVIDLIDAETPSAAHCAAGQLSGALSRRLGVVYSGLLDVMAHFHAVLDYPDEDIDPFRRETITAALDRAQGELSALLATYQRGRQVTRGVPCAIVGRPNAGKSSLLNALLGYDRAIVTSIAGTTRDTIEERCTLGGVLLRLVDTAGLRETGDEIERLGVARSRAALETAELALVVVDGSQPLNDEDRAALSAALAAPNAICVVNKSDLTDGKLPAGLEDQFAHLCTVSAATGAGLDRLEREVAALFPAVMGEAPGELLTNARQYSAAQRSYQALCAAGDSLAAGVSPDAVLMDVEEALSALGELTGKTVREDVTTRIFQRFCVGK